MEKVIRRGRTVRLEQRLRRRPILFPLMLLGCGAGSTGWLILVADHAYHLAITFWLVVAFCILCAVVGAILLPIGAFMALRRRMNTQVLTCPHCGLESRNASRPFRMERPEYVDYVHVVCSGCGADFTVDRYVRLTTGPTPNYGESRASAPGGCHAADEDERSKPIAGSDQTT